MTDHDQPDRDLLDDRMHQRLQRYGGRWRDALPKEVEPAAAAARRRPRRRWLAPAAAAAAVAAVAAVSFAGTRGDDGRPPVNPAEAITPEPGVVPWKPLPPTHPDIPETTPGPSRDEITAEPPCRAADLRIASQQLMPDGVGNIVLSFHVELVSEQQCHIAAGVPGVTMQAGGLPVDVQERPFSGVSMEPALVTPDDSALVSIGWVARNSCPPATNDRIRVRVSQGDAFGVDVSVPASCHLDRAAADPWIMPVLSSLGSGIPSPYGTLSVSGDLDVTAEFGEPIEFEVTLTSPVDLPLVPCPDFRVDTWLDSRIDKKTYGLNCSAVPHVDSGGRPFLPTDVPVTFAMEIGSEPASERLDWTLLAPFQPSTSGVVSWHLPSGTVTGRVTLDGGPAPGTSTPLTSGEVTFTGGKGSGGSASIAPDGTYELELMSGAYDIVVTSPELGGQTCRDATGLTGGAVNEVDISCPFE